MKPIFDGIICVPFHYLEIPPKRRSRFFERPVCQNPLVYLTLAEPLGKVNFTASGAPTNSGNAFSWERRKSPVLTHLSCLCFSMPRRLLPRAFRALYLYSDAVEEDIECDFEPLVH